MVLGVKEEVDDDSYGRLNEIPTVDLDVWSQQKTAEFDEFGEVYR